MEWQPNTDYAQGTIVSMTQATTNPAPHVDEKQQQIIKELISDVPKSKRVV
jgi:hypothetical protein